MKLDESTYEAWLLDRMEGLLSVEQEEALEAFLRERPHLRPEEGSLPTLHEVKVVYPDKAGLRKELPPAGAPTAARLDDFLVARVQQELDPRQEQQLSRLLYEHPAAERQAKLMALAHVPKDPVPYAEKESLQRHFPPQGLPDAHRLTDFLIADLEGDLTPGQRQALLAYLAAHPGARQEQARVDRTKSEPEHMAFPGKQQLKKRPVRVLPLWSRLAVAASVLLLVSAGIWFLRSRQLSDRGGDGAMPIARVDKERNPARTLPAAPVQEPAQPEVPVPQGPVEAPAATHQAPAPTRIAPALPPPNTGHAPQMLPGSGPDLEPAEPLIAEVPEAPQAAQEEEPLALTPDMPATRQVAPTTDERTAGQSLGHYLANAVRGKLLDEPARRNNLDDRDLLAATDKVVRTVTAGEGSVSGQRTDDRERFQLRLGRNFSISGSRQR